MVIYMMDIGKMINVTGMVLKNILIMIITLGNGKKILNGDMAYLSLMIGMKAISSKIRNKARV